MPRFVHRRSHKIGLPPGSLVVMPDAKTDPVHLHLFDFEGARLHDTPLPNAESARPYLDGPGVTWVDVDGVHDVDLIQTLGTHLDLHPLLLEDIVSTGQRPKVEAFDDHLFLVVKMIYLSPEDWRLRAEQVSFVVGPRYVLSFQEVEGDVFDPVRRRLREGKGRIRTRGADYLAYALLDVIVDHYFTVLEAFGDRIEDLEEAVLSNPSIETQRRIRDLRHELIMMRRAVWPLRELFSMLERLDTPLIDHATRPFFRDAYDHAIQAIDVIESMRDLITSLLDLYLSSLSNRMNEVMKFLTIIGTIFIPITFIAGIYGMNFAVMPELTWTWGYPASLVLMLAIALSALYYFRRKRWL